MDQSIKYDVFILVDSGIGNALEALYAVEYCLQQNVKTGIFMGQISSSFQEYIAKCYGSDVLVRSLRGICTKNLIHSFTFQENIQMSFEHYFYNNPDLFSTHFLSETEQYLSVVRALYPSDYNSFTLTRLIENPSEKVLKMEMDKTSVCYAGSLYPNPYKRWPHFLELEKLLGDVIYLGGSDDFNFSCSWVYPVWLGKIMPRKLLYVHGFWKFLKIIGLLKKHAHYKGIESKTNAFFNTFDWSELVYIFRRCKAFVGNDGGLSHLAAASGAKGLVIFGPTSVNKNKAYNPAMKPVYLNYPCQPCQFGVGGIVPVKYFVSCPYEIRCLKNLNASQICKEMVKLKDQN
jgi:hypothetical protein